MLGTVAPPTSHRGSAARHHEAASMRSSPSQMWCSPSHMCCRHTGGDEEEADGDLALDLAMDEEVTDGSSMIAPCSTRQIRRREEEVAADRGTVDLVVDEEAVEPAHGLLHAPDPPPHLVRVEEEEAATPSPHATMRSSGRRGHRRSSARARGEEVEADGARSSPAPCSRRRGWRARGTSMRCRLTSPHRCSSPSVRGELRGEAEKGPPAAPRAARSEGEEGGDGCNAGEGGGCAVTEGARPRVANGRVGLK
jgi:hypothetical protein